MKNKKKIFFSVLALCILIFGVKAFFAAKSYTIDNQYFDYKMYRISASLILNRLNRALCTGGGFAVLVFVVLLVCFFLGKRLCKPVLQKAFNVQIKDTPKSIRIVVATIGSLCFLLYDGWLLNWLLTNHYWFRDLPYLLVLKISANSIITPLAIVLWFILVQGRWERLWLSIKRINPFVMHITWLLALLCVIALVLLDACFAVYQAQNKPSGPNIILIQLETVRSDHLSCYGYERNTAPHIGQLAQDGLLFRNAISPSSWTFPAVASLFSSLYPPSLRLGNEAQVFDNKIFFLAEILKDSGYLTHGIAYSSYVNPKYNLTQGFDKFIHHDVVSGTISSPDITDRALSFIRKNKDNKFFLYLFYHDPHLNYHMHEDFSYYPDYAGSLKSDEPVAPYLEDPSMLEQLSDDDMAFILACYDSEISFTDYHIGKILEELKKFDLYDNSLIIVTADHGEEFNEKGRMGHGYSLYQSLIHVPLIIKTEKNTQGIVHEFVNTIAISPSILNHLGIDQKFDFDGGIIDLHHISVAETMPVYSDVVPEIDSMRSVILGGKKLIADYADTTSYEFYDLTKDPKEENNIYSGDKAIVKKLKEMLLDFSELTKAKKEKLGFEWQSADYREDKGEKEKLRALGYVQ